MNEAAAFIRDHINRLLSVTEDIALGRDSTLFAKVAACLLLISVIGSFTDFLSLGYASELIMFILFGAVTAVYKYTCVLLNGFCIAHFISICPEIFVVVCLNGRPCSSAYSSWNL